MPLPCASASNKEACSQSDCAQELAVSLVWFLSHEAWQGRMNAQNWSIYLFHTQSWIFSESLYFCWCERCQACLLVYSDDVLQPSWGLKYWESRQSTHPVNLQPCHVLWKCKQGRSWHQPPAGQRLHLRRFVKGKVCCLSSSVTCFTKWLTSAMWTPTSNIPSGNLLTLKASSTSVHPGIYNMGGFKTRVITNCSVSISSDRIW